MNRIYGPEKARRRGTWSTDTHLLDASYAFGPALTLSAYGYLMDFDSSDSLSNETVGLRGSGGIPVSGDWKFNYAAEFATQREYGGNPVDYDANYYLLEAGFGLPNLGLKVGYEVLQGSKSAGSAFRTPVASLHTFQGWGGQADHNARRGHRRPLRRGDGQGAGRGPALALP